MADFARSPFLHPYAVHVMVDIETASLHTASARITSIAYTQFNFHNTELGAEYQVAVIPYGYNMVGLPTIDDEDVLIWRAVNGIDDMERGLMRVDVMTMLATIANRFSMTEGWGTKSENFFLWSSKPHFDIAILERHFKHYHDAPPWKYYQPRDLVTFVESLGREYRAFKQLVTDSDKWDGGANLHDARNDCHFQIDMIHEAIGIGKVLAGDNPPADNGGG